MTKVQIFQKKSNDDKNEIYVKGNKKIVLKMIFSTDYINDQIVVKGEESFTWTFQVPQDLTYSITLPFYLIGTTIDIYDGDIKISSVDILHFGIEEINILQVQPLNNYSWEEISNIASIGKARSYWGVGDAKQIELNGTINGYTFSSQINYAYIIGFNHNIIYEGDNLIHFAIGTVNTLAGITLKIYTAFNECEYVMNTTNSSEGGWENCNMRINTCQDFLNILPMDLQLKIKKVNKYTHNYTGGKGNAIESNVTVSQEKIFLMSEFEVSGKIKIGNPFEAAYQQQYDFFKRQGTAIRYKTTNTASAAYWWLRTPSCANVSSQGFCHVIYNGQMYEENANIGDNQLVPCFCI